MFKSVFAKYVSVFMVIILISFSVITAILTSIIKNNYTDLKVGVMETAANISKVYLENQVKNPKDDGIKDVVERDKRNIESMFSMIHSTNKDLTMFLTDADGKIVLAKGSDTGEITPDSAIPKEIMGGLSEGQPFSNKGSLKGVFTSSQLIYAVPVFDESEALSGTVFVCSSSDVMADLVQEITHAIVLAILWVMMAAMIAVYFITERITVPLKKISVAARQFAKGKFDTRVPVSGSDEVAELAVAFNNMAESLDNYDTMRNTFISNVSHDLRTPMTSISGFVDGILDGVIPPEKYNYYLTIVSNEVKRLSRLVASLLDLSRIQAGERKFTMAPFDICEMARQIIISFEQKIEEKKLDIEFNCDEDNMSVVADRDAIYQIMYNLCDNAVKFSTEGKALKINIKHIKNKKVWISVYNEGNGIAPADLPYVFERFYKSDKSRGLNKSGVGLGLYISKTIIDAHNEEIWVESDFGKNCCFNFTLSSEPNSKN